MLWSGIKNLSLRFFTVYNGYCNLSRFFLKISLMEWSTAQWNQADFQRLAQPSLSGYMISSSPRTLHQFLSGIVHFFAILWVARYRAFNSAVSLGNTLLCLFRRRYPLLRLLSYPKDYRHISRGRPLRHDFLARSERQASTLHSRFHRYVWTIPAYVL